MFSRLHNKLGTAGLVVAIVALVAALAGTAIAAVGLNSQQKQEIKKIAKKFAGKQGPVGPAGPAGKDGADGSDADGTASSGTQTGVWGFETESSFHIEAISYPETLAAQPTPKWVGAGETVAGCPGTASNPQAEAGNFCMYAEELVSASAPSGWNSYTTAKKSGSVVEFAINSGELGYGSWAVTPAATP